MTTMNTGMTFGDCIRELKKGHKLHRLNWNGKGMYLVYFSPVAHGMEILKVEGQCEKPLLPFILMKTSDDNLVPWLASQTDMLSEDWAIVAEIDK